MREGGKEGEKEGGREGGRKKEREGTRGHKRELFIDYSVCLVFMYMSEAPGSIPGGCRFFSVL